MERVIRLENKELERAYSAYFMKIKEVRKLLDGMEKVFRDLDITSCDERTLKAFIHSDAMISSAMATFGAGREGLEKILGGGQERTTSVQ